MGEIFRNRLLKKVMCIPKGNVSSTGETLRGDDEAGPILRAGKITCPNF